jgi:hypothetical protein
LCEPSFEAGPAPGLHTGRIRPAANRCLRDLHALYHGGLGRWCGVGRGRGVALGVGLAVGVGVGVIIGVIVGVTVGLIVAVGVGVIVGVGVGVEHGSASHQVILTVSKRHPSLEPLLSLAILQRSLLGLQHPIGRLTTVVMKPFELPLQARRPAIGLPRLVLIVRLYPPMTKLPPAARISWNVFPSSTLISSTPPSKPRPGSSSDASRLKLCRKTKSGENGAKEFNCSESSSLSLTMAGSSINPAFGSVSAGGIGTPELEVTHNGGEP